MKQKKQRNGSAIFLVVILLAEIVVIIFLFYKWKTGDFIFREEKKYFEDAKIEKIFLPEEDESAESAFGQGRSIELQEI